MDILLLKDIPERGRRWVKGTTVYGVDPNVFNKYIESGHAKAVNVKEPIWGVKKEDLKDEEE